VTVHRDEVSNLHVAAFEPLTAPSSIREEIPVPPAVRQSVLHGRAALRNALEGRDPRLLVVTGPCSIHDTEAALDYARRLARLRDRVGERLLVVMRVYFEKPRTTVGWKGLINDPAMDGSCDVESGIRQARRLLLDIGTLGLPCATEFLDPVVPQYTADLVAWAAIGARTSESQTHRELASGLSMPVGFKNATDGSLQVAIDAMVAAKNPHAFLGVGPAGRSSVVRTTGNPNVHLVLRGGGGRANFSRADIAYARIAIEEALGQSLARPIVVDCSHDNSGKDYRRQPAVFEQVVTQRQRGESAVLGVMLESNLVAGKQKLASTGKPPSGFFSRPSTPWGQFKSQT
jgi:3-deoxy-7-phosphoheptulonate synthase